MASAPQGDTTAAFLAQLARERERYALPTKLRHLGEQFIHQALELLFPHSPTR
jgi:hypothetical protein